MTKHLQTHPLCSSLVWLGCVMFTSAAFGQARLPANTVSAADATLYRTQIEAFVHEAVTKINSDDTNAQKQGRDALVNQAADGNATPSFFDVFANALNKEMTSADIEGNKDLRVRLNAAIAVARVAARANNTRLEPIAASFIKDKSDPVCLWGIKAAEGIIPAMLAANQQPNNLAPLIVDAVKTHAVGCVVEEAYAALTLTNTLTGNSNRNVNPAAIQGFVQYPLSLLEYRAGLYQNETPPSPAADRLGANFLVAGNVLSAMPVRDQSKLLSLMTALLEGAGKQLPNQTSDNGDKDGLVELIRRLGDAFQVAGDVLKAPSLGVAAKPISSISNDPDPTDLSTKIEKVKDAVHSLNLSSVAAQ